MGRYNKYQRNSYTHAQSHTHTHTFARTHARTGWYQISRTHNGRTISWWLVLGWVTTKEYHPLLRLDRQTSTYGALTKTFNNNNNTTIAIIAIIVNIELTYFTLSSSICSSSDATLISSLAFSRSASSSVWRASSSSAWYMALIWDVSLPHFDFNFSNSSANLRFCISRLRTLMRFNATFRSTIQRSRYTVCSTHDKDLKKIIIIILTTFFYCGS